MRYFIAVCIGVCMLVFHTATAPAFKGRPDTENRFPYVARVLASGGQYCTGIIITKRMVLTAAHCIWENGSYKRGVSVQFWDERDKVDRTILAERLYVTETYRKTEPSTAEVDIGIILPEEHIRVSRYPKTILDIHPPFSRAKLYSKETNVKWTEQTTKSVIRTLLEHILNNDHETGAIGVGYGTTSCDTSLEECEPTDFHRRWEYVRMVVHTNGHDSVSFKAKRTDGGGTGFTPFLPGDSGGPLIAEHETSGDSEWILVGVHSRSNAAIAKNAPLLSNASFILNFVQSRAYNEALTRNGTIAIAAVAANGRAAVGFARTRYESEARFNALAQCGINGCKIVDVITSGCRYATTGTRWPSVKWATGRTRSAAYERCRQGGFSCKQPTGGCLPN